MSSYTLPLDITIDTDLDASWRHVLAQPDIQAALDTQGYAPLTFQRFRDLAVRRDARLMTKLDTLQSRPAVFEERDLSLFPITNKSLAVVKGTAPYLRIDPKRLKGLERRARLVDEKDPVVDLQSLALHDITSEGNLILVLQNARILSLIHHAQNGAVAMTGMGRRRMEAGQAFDITLPTPGHDVALHCTGVQFEMDSLHESAGMITMAEAKLLNYGQPFSKVSSLHLRQIVFPTLWLKDRLDKIQSAKRLEPAVVLARPNTKARDSWTVFWLPVHLDTTSPTLHATVAWDRAIAFALEQSQATKRPIQPQHLHALPVPNRAVGARLPQYNTISVIDRIALEIGRLGVDSGGFTHSQALDLRAGSWQRHAAVLNTQAKPVCWNKAMAAIPTRLHGGPRQHAYLRDALEWLGFIQSWDATTQTVQPTALAMAYAHSDRSIQIQTLWNAMRTSPLVRAAVQDIPFDQLPAASLKTDGLCPTSSTARRRYEAARNWTAWLAVEVRRHRETKWGHMPQSWTQEQAA